MKLTVQDLAMFLGCEFIGKYKDMDSQNSPLTLRVSHLKKYEDGEYEFIKPMLRLISDMTEEEKEFTAYRGGWDLTTPTQLKFLIQKHIDVFNWIEKGLAISKV